MAVLASALISLIRVDDGAAGIGVVSVTEHFAKSADKNVAPTTWSTTVPTITELDPYLWNYETFNYTDGSTSDTPKRIIGVYGTKGEPGQSLSKVEAQFYLSNSKITQTGGSWSTTPPEWVEGKYLWTRQKLTYSNPVKTEYTIAVVDSTWEAVNKIKIGGTNLIKNSRFVSDKYWEINGTPNVIECMIKDGAAWGHLVSTGNAKQGYRQNQSFDFAVEAGSEFVLSAKIVADVANKRFGMGIQWLNYAGNIISESWDTSIVNTPLTPTRISKVVTAPTGDEIKAFNVIFGIGTSYSTDVYFTDVKLEQGNKPSDWSPAPSDIQDDLGSIHEEILNQVENIQSHIISSIDANNEHILSTVRETFVSVDDFTNKTTELGQSFSEINQRVDGITFNFNEFKTDAEHFQTEIQSYISFQGSTITLGNSESMVVCKLDNQKLGFYLKDNPDDPIAYFSDQELHVTKIDCGESSRFGNFAFVPRGASLDFKKVK